MVCILESLESSNVGYDSKNLTGEADEISIGLRVDPVHTTTASILVWFRNVRVIASMSTGYDVVL